MTHLTSFPYLLSCYFFLIISELMRLIHPFCYHSSPLDLSLLLQLNAPTASFQLLTRFNSLKDSWIASSRKLASAKSVDWNVLRKTVFVAAHAPPHSLPPSLSRPSSISSLYPTPLPSSLPSSNPLSGCKSFSLRTFALQQLSAICTEQDRLRALFISDVSRALGYRIRGAADRINCLYGTHLLDRSERSPSVQQIVHNYQKLSVSLIPFLHSSYSKQCAEILTVRYEMLVLV